MNNGNRLLKVERSGLAFSKSHTKKIYVTHPEFPEELSFQLQDQ